MSEIKVNSIKGVGASSAAITVNNTDGTCTANLTNRTNKNLIINGGMTIAQRGVSSTTGGYQTVDRIEVGFADTDENPTQSQVDVASGTTPYTSGFRKAYRITNGNQTSGAGTSDIIDIKYSIESQDLANSGWNYTTSSSNVTLQFWIKSSVAQNFFGHLVTNDGTSQNYPFETGSLSADTWTKITKTISGNSNLTFNNDNGQGLYVDAIRGFDGTDRTGSMSLNAWAAYNSSVRTPDQTSTWYTTNDATLEITGLQLEVGSVATDFEHRSFAQELDLCMRYYQKSYEYAVAPGTATSNDSVRQSDYASINYAGFHVPFMTTMRDNPTVTLYSTTSGATGKMNADSTVGTAATTSVSPRGFMVYRVNDSGGVSGSAFLRCQFQAEAEL